MQIFPTPLLPVRFGLHLCVLLAFLTGYHSVHCRSLVAAQLAANTNQETTNPTEGDPAARTASAQQVVLASDDHAIAIFAEDLDIAAETSGIVQQLNVAEGDLIGNQEVLVTLKDQRAQLEFELATLQLELAEQKARSEVDSKFAKETIALAEKNIQRSTVAGTAVAQSEIDQYQFEKKRGTLALEQAAQDRVLSVLEAKTAAAQKDLADYDLGLHKVRAPIEGVVVELYQRPGEFLQAGQPLLRMVKNDVMRISAAIDLEKASQLRKDLPVLFHPSHSTQTEPYSGKIIFVSPETFGEIRTVKVLAEVQVPQRNLKAKVAGLLEILAPQ